MYYIGDEEIEALRELFGKKRLYRYHTTGPSLCDQFESEFSAVLGTEHSILLSSGTNAIVAALIAAGVQPGDEVLVPTYTFVATAAAVVQAGAIPVLVNIDSQLSLSKVDALSRLTSKTKAILAVHMDGLAADLQGLSRLAVDHKLVLIEDVAQALGGSYKGRRLGSIGDFGCFSLNENKILSCGEGGILTTSDRAAYERAFCLHDTPAQFNPTKKDFFTQGLPFIGGSMRVSEIQGTIMRVQLTRLSRILAELRERKAIFREVLGDLPDVQILTGHCADGDCGSSLHLQFADQVQALTVARVLREKGLLFAPVTTRPAHVSWKWSHLLGERSHLQPARNPYLLADSPYLYNAADYLESVGLLMRTMRMEIDLKLSVDETRALAQTARGVLQNGN